MDFTITATYCLCEEFSKAMGLCDDSQARMTTAEVMCVALVAAAFFGGNIEKTRLFLHEYGYIKSMLSKSRLNRRLHAIKPDLWQALFGVLAEIFKERNDDGAYVVDSLPVAVCDNIRIGRCRLYPLEAEGESFRGYIPSRLYPEQTPLFLRFAGASGGEWQG